MTARDIFTGWTQAPSGSRYLPPPFDDDFYQQYEDRQRDRWAKEEGARPRTLTPTQRQARLVRVGLLFHRDDLRRDRDVDCGARWPMIRNDRTPGGVYKLFVAGLTIQQIVSALNLQERFVQQFLRRHLRRIDRRRQR